MSTAPIAQGQVDVNVRPVAWLHDQPERYDVVHDEARALWLKAWPKQVEHYTIPLYRHERREPLTTEAGRAAAMEPAAEEVKDAVQWISVDDRLPDLDTDVMVYPYPAYQVMTARFGFIQKKDIAPCWHFSEYILNYGWKEQEVDPTHWMPLPKTPVEEGEK